MRTVAIAPLGSALILSAGDRIFAITDFYIMGTNHTSIHRNGTQMANQRLGKFMVWVCTKSRQGIFKHLLVHTHHLPYRGLVVYVWCKDGTKPPLLVVSLVSPSGHTIPCLNMPDFQR